MDLRVYRATDRIAVNPYSFDAGKGPGIETIPAIMALAKAAGCGFDAGRWMTPVFITNLPERDEDLIALLQLAQVIKNY